jgi:poly(3-hydroxybutyrate) depolymerase
MAAMQSGAHTSAADSAAPPTIVFHGDADATVHQRNGQLLTPRHLAADSTAVPPAQTSGRPATRSLYRDAQGQVVVEHWQVHGAGHAWSGGSAQGSYTDPKGPDASAEMLRFFFSQ